MFDRTQRVRQRERLFLDTLDQHYAQFSTEATASYDSWREYAREEAIAIRELTKSARWRTGMGVATIVASIVYGSNSDSGSFSDRDDARRIDVRRRRHDARESGAQAGKAAPHGDARGVVRRFRRQLEPMVVEIQGTQHRLTGHGRRAVRGVASAAAADVHHASRVSCPRTSRSTPSPTPEAPVELPPVPEARRRAPAAVDAAPAAADEATTEAADADASAGDGV